MKRKKSSAILRRISHLRLLIPGVLVAVLVLDGLLGYTMPDISDGIEAVPQKAYAAEAPELEELAQTGERAESKGPAAKLARVDEPAEYKDGVYTGSARGFGGIVTVRVTIKEGKIASIKVISAPGETGSYLARAKAVIGVVLKKQSTNVDAVSGASYSSNGIIKAVRNALAKAVKNKSDKPSREDDKDGGKKDKKPKPDPVTEGTWNDGTYTGEGEGFGGKLHVQITIKDGKITAIKLLDSKDGEEFMKKAKAGIFKAVMNKQGTDVDSVTGATFSSYGLIEAINDALKMAASDTGDDPGDDQGDVGGSGTDPEDGTSDKVYKDGTYSSTVTCTRSGWFDYDIIITLTVKAGRIDTLSVYKGEDYTEDEYDREENDGYLDMAVNGYGSRTGIISRILETQSADVDTVTGATYSSSAIKSGVSGILSGIVTEKKTEEDKKSEDVNAVVAQDETTDANIPSETEDAEEEMLPEEDPEPEEAESTDETQEQVKESDPPQEEEDPPQEDTGQPDEEG